MTVYHNNNCLLLLLYSCIRQYHFEQKTPQYWTCLVHTDGGQNRKSQCVSGIYNINQCSGVLCIGLWLFLYRATILHYPAEGECQFVEKCLTSEQIPSVHVPKPEVQPEIIIGVSEKKIQKVRKLLF